jgi:osmotically-inducible protein OsmY
MSHSEEQLKRSVVREIVKDSQVDASDVKVEVSGGQVTLSGTVPNYRAHGAAKRAALLAGGVIDVINLLMVRHPAVEPDLSDEDIGTRVRDRLASILHGHGEDIEVSVEDGVVALSGTVDAYWNKEKASEVAGELPGVSEVKDQIAVATGEGYVDKDIAAEIGRKLDHSLFVAPEEVTIEVSDGHVVLTGEVRSLVARATVEAAVTYIPGVQSFDSGISVSSNPRAVPHCQEKSDADQDAASE